MDMGSTPSRTASWPVRRLFPLLATVIMAAAGMAGTIWGPRFYGKTAWALPDDLWGTLIAAQRLAHLDLAGLYTYPTQLVSLPGAAIWESELEKIAAVAESAATTRWREEPKAANATSGSSTV